eukprot:CAMPEP_0116092582 /NCGR_PEP_ID=MMETSP0327-20121206/8123_1 /TAXON_ID=44447 /ORGANISM="Pseudo-nitzschia delicatissima, Strain B596" /LENGTH=394 /DNA_ID=CAMNT_0003584025 /DNA_START=231 /DNA_END=1415 /DNA_ORIENTATION=-
MSLSLSLSLSSRSSIKQQRTKPTQLCAVNGNGETSCLPPGRLAEIKRIFLISDATGVMSRSILLKALAQFDTCADEKAPYATQQNKDDDNKDDDDDDDDNDSYESTAGTCDVRTRTFTFVRTETKLSQILRMAKERGACVMYTIAQSQLRVHAREECARLGLAHSVDLIGPSLDALSEFLQDEPLGIPALFLGGSKQGQQRSLSNLSDSYYQRIDAVEFCLKADDGQAPWLLPEADIVLVGVSRSGKTPLSVVLSQTMSLKVANMPLVMEVPPPTQLLEEVDPNRVFCLTISPSELRRIRTNRLEKRGVTKMEAKLEDEHSSNGALSPPKSNYADRNYILKDLGSVRKLCQKHNWTEIDVTGRAVEETATSIVEIFNQRFSPEGSSGISNQHIG